MADQPLRNIPSVSKILDTPVLIALREGFAADVLTNAVRAELDHLRQQLIRLPSLSMPTIDELARRVAAGLQRDDAPRLRVVINATGIVLHTNLGRSPLALEAAQAAFEAARGYLNLELDLDSGKRSSRQLSVRRGLIALTGAESATAVNNCAAATVIVLRALAQGREVIVSRGQLIEIGGSFRIPDILAVSGAMLREVGTTNITRLADYESAIGPKTGLIMRIHPSNYRVRGFTKSVDLPDLVELGKTRQIPVIDDVGSGAAVDLTPFGLPGEPIVSESIRQGADLVLFSGDKLLGGPQAGVIAGRTSWIQQIEKDPLMRAFRLDKMSLAALEATLRLYRNPDRVRDQIPTLRMMTTPIVELRSRCERLVTRLQNVSGLKSIELRDAVAYVGGGSLPDQALPTVVVALSPHDLSEDEFARRLRTGTPAVVGRLHEGQLWLDLRTVFEHQEEALVQAITHALASSHSVTHDTSA